MKNGFIKVASATPHTEVADCIYNTKKIVELMDEAHSKGVKFLVLPELCITGYGCSDLFFQNQLLSSAIQGLLSIAEHSSKLKDILVAVGLPILNGQKLYNCAALILNGDILGIVPKSNIPNYSEFYEARHFFECPKENTEVKIGGKYIPFGSNLIFNCENLPGFSIAVEICEDMWSLSPPSVRHARAGATVIANLSASSEFVGKAPYRKKLVSIQSAKLLCVYIYSDLGEGESTTDIVFAGHNIIAERGKIISESKMFENSMIINEIDLEKIAYERRRISSFPVIDTEGYKKIPFNIKIGETTLTREVHKTPFVPKFKEELFNRCEYILSIQSGGLKKRFLHTKSSKIILGLSGGLDSTLALLVALRVIDNLKRPHSDIMAVNMPCFGTSAKTKNNALNLAKQLGISIKVIDITKEVLEHFENIEHSTEEKDTTYENSQARIRTLTLMSLANKHNGIVIGTGDLSELALGFATYNGDHMSMYSVNASVPKTIIPSIIKYEMTNINNQNIKDTLSDIINTPISPELIPAKNGQISQLTEDIIGPYTLHDFFLHYAIRWAFTPSKIYRLAKKAFAGIYTDETILKWLKSFYKRFFSQQFKRSCMPDGPKVGSVSLSPRGDMRMPSDASANIWLKELETL